MAELKSTNIDGSATVSTTLGVTGAQTVGGTLGVTGTSTLGTTNMGAASASSMETSGNFKITSGSPSQYRICRQQSGTSGLVQWVDFAVYDTNGSTRLF